MLCLVTDEQIDLVIMEPLETACWRVLFEPELIRKLLQHRMREQAKAGQREPLRRSNAGYGPLATDLAGLPSSLNPRRSTE